MRSMTGYGRGEVDAGGVKICVELNSVNRKQGEIMVNIPRELIALEPLIRQAINEKLSRGRTTVIVSCSNGSGAGRNVSLDTALARSYQEAMRALQHELGTPGEIDIRTILQAPGVLQLSSPSMDPDQAWPGVERALQSALTELIRMRAREGDHLEQDLRARVDAIRGDVARVRELFPGVVERYRAALSQRIQNAGLAVPPDDERLAKEVALFADRSDISEELTRLESHLSQFVDHLGKDEPVGRTLEFLTQEIARELNTLAAKGNDAAISRHIVSCKAELEKIREQIQNLE